MELQEYQIGTMQNGTPCMIPYRDIVTSTGLIRIEYYHNDDPDNPIAYQLYLMRMGVFASEQKANPWATVGVETMTTMELNCRKYNEKVVKPMDKFAPGTDTRQWYALTTDDMEEMVIMRFAGLKMNVVLVSHVDERKNELNGEIIRGPYAPGRLSRRSMLGASYQEQYKMYVVEQEGKRLHQLQTASRGGFAATTQIGTPDPCYPDYESLWQNWEGERPPIHVLVYADTGSGKSEFLSTFPKPMLIWHFDPYGKDLPYIRKGVQ